MVRRGLVVAIGVALVVGLVGLAVAANRVEVKVTSEPIGYHSPCDKGGSFSFEFDPGTVVQEGDQITIDLPYGVTLCKDVDLYVLQGSGNWYWENGEIPDDSQDESPLTYKSSPPVVDGGIYFHVYGSAGSQRLTIDVIGENPGDSISVNGTDPDARLVLYILDQRTNDDFTVDGLYTDFNGTAATPATEADNTYCINVSEWEETTVDVSLDSAGDKYTFIPSNPEIAHVMEATTYSQYECKGQPTCKCSKIKQPAAQEEPHGCIVDPGIYKIIKAGDTFDDAKYKVVLELHGPVYWATNRVTVEAFYPGEDPCSKNGTDVVEEAHAYTADGREVKQFGGDDCEVEDEEKAKVLEIDLFNLNDYRYIKILMPSVAYDLHEIGSGGQIDVTVSLNKKPCGGAVFEETLCLLVLAESCEVPEVPECRLFFPYTTEMAEGADKFIDGMALVNRGSEEMVCTLTFYEADGDSGTLEVTVPAKGMWVKLLSDIVDDISSNGTMGDDRAFIEVTCTGVSRCECDGFLFLGTGYQAQGYLPRTECCVCDHKK